MNCRIIANAELKRARKIVAMAYSETPFQYLSGGSE
jgi:hypothetical protein